MPGHKRKRRPSTAGNARKIRKLSKRLHGFDGEELNFLDTFQPLKAVVGVLDCTGSEIDPDTFLCLNAVGSGTGPTQRSGRFYKMVSIKIKVRCLCGGQEDLAAVPRDASVFIALVLDKQTNKAQLNSEDVFTNPSAANGTMPLVFPNMEHTDRFTILKSELVVLPIAAATMTQLEHATTPLFAHGLVEKTFEWNVNLRGMKVLMEGTSNTVANIMDKSLHMLAFGHPGSPATFIDYSARLRFTR